jgi:starvation-inducible DNA-binding protein
LRKTSVTYRRIISEGAIKQSIKREEKIMNTKVKTHMYTSRNDLDESVRQKSIEILNVSVATCLDVWSQAKQAHWNVKGLDFYQVHLLFDDVASTLFDPIDLLAERITALGGVVYGTARAAGRNSLIPEYPDTEQMTEVDHLNALADRVAMFAKHLREAADRTAAFDDQDTNDIYVEISREVDKKLWFIEAHLQRHQ